MSATNDVTIRIGGEAGQGVESSGAGFAQAFARAGLHVFGLEDYMSRIRGGHNFYQVRASPDPLYSHQDEVHVLIALDGETIARHGGTVVPDGAVICDESLVKGDDRSDGIDDIEARVVAAPLRAIAREEGTEVMANTAALAVAAALTEFEPDTMHSVIRDNFATKGQQIIDANLTVARRGYEFGRQQEAEGFGYRLSHLPDAPPRMVLNGNQAICLGALLGGCRFVAAYPMTPATSIIQWMSAHADRYGLVTKHVEDELAALLMAIGANHMGVRGMAATSGGGFSLMAESLGLAGITETPVVIVESQRPGPATGMPTRTSQGDLQFVLHASQGEFPRIVLTPITIEDCFRAGWRAFNLAEKYQCPVIILVDNYLSNSVRSIERPDLHFEDVTIDRGALLSDSELDELGGDYMRYELTETGISPRAMPGHPKAVFQACSDEHDEHGYFDSEGAENRVNMVRKRLRKLDAALADMRPPESYGPENADVTLVGWGSTYGPIREAVERMNADGGSANSLHFADMWPFAADEALPRLRAARRTVCVENNATGQFARLLRAYTGMEMDGHIRRFDGRPFSPQYIRDRLD